MILRAFSAAKITNSVDIFYRQFDNLLSSSFGFPKTLSYLCGCKYSSPPLTMRQFVLTLLLSFCTLTLSAQLPLVRQRPAAKPVKKATPTKPSVQKQTPAKASASVSKKTAHVPTSKNSPTSKKSTQKRTYDYANDTKEWVDLGLPSGTLWATCNVGATKPEEYGDYFAWGETTGYKNGKSYFYYESYKYYDNEDITRYTSTFYGPDIALVLQDDAAYVYWGSDWRMPTYRQQDELREECTWLWTKLNGVNGYLVKSLRNGHSIFLPAAGRRDGYDLEYVRSTGYYWSRSLGHGIDAHACCLIFESDYMGSFAGLRCDGYSIRAVRTHLNAVPNRIIEPTF